MEWSNFTNAEPAQRSNEWLERRKKRLGGSEIASVLQISPYKTRLQLWEEKTGIAPTVSISHLPHVKRGIDAEPIICEKVETLLGVSYTQPSFVHPIYPFMACSLDGYCDDHIAEFKTMGAAKHRDVSSGVVPEYYQVQCQWNMMVTSSATERLITKCLYASYRPEDQSLHMTWIHRDERWQKEIIERAIEFWGWVETRTRPKELELGL